MILREDQDPHNRADRLNSSKAPCVWPWEERLLSRRVSHAKRGFTASVDELR